MKYRKMTAGGDAQFGGGSRVLLTGAEAVGQAVKTRLLLLLGEWWEDTADGLPLFEHLLGRPNLAAAELIVRDRVRRTPGVTEVQDLKLALGKDRRLSVACDVLTEYGETVVEATL